MDDLGGPLLSLNPPGPRPGLLKADEPAVALQPISPISPSAAVHTSSKTLISCKHKLLDRKW